MYFLSKPLSEQKIAEVAEGFILRRFVQNSLFSKTDIKCFRMW